MLTLLLLLPGFKVIPSCTVPTSVSSGRVLSSAAKNWNKYSPVGTVDSDASSMMEELSYVQDSWDSSASSGEEEVDESREMVEVFLESEDVEQKYLSALEFNSGYNSLFKKPSQSTMGSGSLRLSNNAVYPLEPEHLCSSFPVDSDWNFSCVMAQNHDIGWPLDSIEENHNCNVTRDIDDAYSYKHKYDLSSGVQEHNTSYHGDVDAFTIFRDLSKDVSHRHRHPSVGCANQMMGTGKLRERCSKVYLPSYDFMSIRDPFVVCVDRLDRGDRLNAANSTVTMKNHNDKGHALNVNKNSSHTYVAPLGFRTDHQEQVAAPKVSGGPCQKDLPNGYGEHKITVVSVAEIPLDFVLEKCLLEEIQLQYIYVSKLTIKLLEEGFSLQEHLLALRRYHMMESADWADLFIVSLWHHKWNATEADKRISEAQGLLELSVQRSSCEKDQYKDRLFVYTKEQGSASLPAFETGIQSFDVLGLGYRVDWPVSIVLTPGALKLYARIFSFLIQVKLALSSLTDVWCSLKKFRHFTNQHHYSESRKSVAPHFNIMVKLRHHIFHFVSTLQQYVQSQLSHVSWCRFLTALEHKVKDLTDLNFVHMDYLNDSQCICFLSSDAKQTADIIQSILQCALDLKSVMPNNSSGLDGLNIAQVLSIKKAFDENIRKLYGCYLKSPKNVEFSLPRFWEYLNYNDHYSNTITKEMDHHVFSFGSL